MISGNVVYFHVGAGHAKELSEAIAKLGPQYASVRIEYCQFNENQEA